MVILKPITRESATSFRIVRLRALQDTPSAFGSTYAKESQWSETDWEERAAQWNSDRSTGLLAWDGDDACGIAAGFLDRDEAAKAHLISMWVAPSHRRQGIGQLLVNGVIDWARSRHAKILRLDVTSNNDAAIRFYERLGFTKTGRTQPYPNDSSLLEFEMSRAVDTSTTSPCLDTMLSPPSNTLSFGQVRLRFVRVIPADSSRGFVPAYHFRILIEDGSDVGHINFRVGDTEHIRVCAGHIGFEIHEPFRGHGYALQACRAIAPFVRSVYEAVTITCDPDNHASIRTIERLGATFTDEIAVPEHDPHYQRGSRRKRRYKWTP